MLVGQCGAEDLVVDPEVLAVDARLRRARCTSGFEYENGFARQPARHPPLDRTAAQPFVLEQIKQLKIGEA
jgi:hypothetical protein